MIVGYDVTVLRNNHTGTETYARLGLYLTLLSAAVTEEKVKNIRHTLHRLSFTQLLGAYMYYGVNRILRRLCQINRLRIRCVVSGQPQVIRVLLEQLAKCSRLFLIQHLIGGNTSYS